MKLYHLLAENILFQDLHSALLRIAELPYENPIAQMEEAILKKLSPLHDEIAADVIESIERGTDENRRPASS